MNKYIIILSFCFFSSLSFSQTTVTGPKKIELNPDKVNTFVKYLEFKYGSAAGGFEGWKKSNPDLYLKEMWYLSESFYFKTDYLTEGITLPQGSIFIPRFEEKRKENDEAIVILPGFKDALVLLPANKLIYKPN